MSDKGKEWTLKIGFNLEKDIHRNKLFYIVFKQNQYSVGLG